MTAPPVALAVAGKPPRLPCAGMTTMSQVIVCPAFWSIAVSSESIGAAAASWTTSRDWVPGFENARAAAGPAVMKTPCTNASVATLEMARVLMGPGI